MCVCPVCSVPKRNEALTLQILYLVCLVLSDCAMFLCCLESCSAADQYNRTKILFQEQFLV